MASTPESRLARLARHARLGWRRSQQDERARERARAWILRYPSGLPEADRLWLECLDGRGPLASWLEGESSPGAWTQALALHSVLASHPFADLAQWSSLPTSRAS